MNSWTKINNIIEKTYKFVIGYLFFLIIAALLYLAAMSTTFIDRYEKIYFLPDSPVRNVLVLLFALTAVTLLYVFANKSAKLKKFHEQLERDESFFRRIKSILLWGIWAAAGLWAVCTQVPATADQRFTLLAAQYIAKRDFTVGGPVSYLYIFNNQLGWTMLLFVLNRVFGELNYIAYQLLNAAAIVLIVRELSEFASLFGVGGVIQLIIILTGFVFAPLILYVSFIYGTLPGLLLSLMAIRLEIVFFRTGRWHQAALSAFLVCLAVLMKMNYMIFLMAMLIYAAINLLGKAKLNCLVFLIFTVLFYSAQAVVPTIFFEKISGESLPEGCSTWSWAAMGLQDGERPGWYNYYNDITLAQSEYNSAKQEVLAKEDLKFRLSELWQDKDAARDFFVRKTASMWNEPSLQSVWIAITHYQAAYSQEITGVDNDWPKAVLSPMGNYALTSYLNYLNFIILSGAALYIVLCSKSEQFFESLILPMTVIGGFLFHLVWEAKGQYTLPYFVLLLPYTVMGFSEAARRICAIAGGERAPVMVNRKELVVKTLLLALAVLILWYVFHGTLGSITCDTEAYYAYLAAHS